MKTKLKNQKGFTIIEVLIVLAIAGLILLIVFLAVPALQRNSRNTSLRNDAAVVIGYANDYAANNNGGTPASGCYDPVTGNVGLSSTLTCVPATNLVGKVRGGIALSFVTATPTQPTATGTIVVALGFKCSGNTITGGTATPRALAAGFKTETAGTAADQCTES